MLTLIRKHVSMKDYDRMKPLVDKVGIINLKDVEEDESIKKAEEAQKNFFNQIDNNKFKIENFIDMKL